MEKSAIDELYGRSRHSSLERSRFILDTLPGYGRWPEVYWHFSREIHWQYHTTKGILKYQSGPPVANHMSLRGVEEWQKIVKSLWAFKVKNSVALRAKLETMADPGGING